MYGTLSYMRVLLCDEWALDECGIRMPAQPSFLLLVPVFYDAAFCHLFRVLQCPLHLLFSVQTRIALLGGPAVCDEGRRHL